MSTFPLPRRLALLPAALLAAACATGRPAATDRAPQPTPVPQQAELVTDRPDFTESPLVVPTRSVQLEMGHSMNRAGGVTENALGEILLRVGLHPRAELRVEGNSVVFSHENGARSIGREDSGVGVKLSLVPEREGRHLLPTTAILLGTSLPTGSAALRSRALTPEAKLAMAWGLAEGWELSSNANVASTPAAGERVREYVGSLSLGHDLSERLGAYAEVYGGRTSRGEGSRFANAGLTFAAAALFQLDARVGTGFGPSAGDRFVGVGVSRRW